MRPADDKNHFYKVLRAFLANNRADGRYLLEALHERGGGGDDEAVEVDLDQLVRTASRRAARRNPDLPLDQQDVRKRYLALFRQFETTRIGKLTVGRRGHPTRFRFLTPGADGGFRAIGDVLAGTGAGPPPRSRETSEVLDPVAPRTAEPAAHLRRDDVVAKLRARERDIHNLGVSSLSLFGSVARDEAGPDSDVDLLATFDSPITSDGFFGAKFFLEDLLGKRIDLVTQSALRNQIREAILPGLIRVA